MGSEVTQKQVLGHTGQCVSSSLPQIHGLLTHVSQRTLTLVPCTAAELSHLEPRVTQMTVST